MISATLLSNIFKHFEECAPKEGCGVLAVKRGKLKWIPCTNVAAGDDDFALDPEEYLNIYHTHDIVGIVHSHVEASCEPSTSDIKYCNASGIPYYIFSYPSMDCYKLEPKNSDIPLMGRDYEWGITDCLEAVRDYYRKEMYIDLKKKRAYKKDWWKSDENYMTDEHIKEWGFSPVDNLQKNDLLIFAIERNIPNHCGVYLGNDLFYHHMENRISCRENIYPLWKRFFKQAYRYET